MHRREFLAAMVIAGAGAWAESPVPLWDVICAPETPYAKRLASVEPAAKTFPLTDLPRLVKAVSELRQEQVLHNWGMDFSPNQARPLAAPLQTATPRVILGHRWVPPARRVPYPLTSSAEAMAPWPWQVQQCLVKLYGLLAPHDAPAARRWLNACMLLPCTTDAECLAFLEACSYSSHWKSVPVLARYWRIGQAKRMPLASSRVGQAIASDCRLWDDPLSQPLAHCITVDLLDGSILDARHQAAYGLRDLCLRWHEGKEIRLPEPTTAILRALELSRGAEASWTRLYVYVFSVCQALEKPPFPADRRLPPTSPKVAELLRDADKWYQSNRPRLLAAAKKEAPRLAEARALLMAGV